MNQETAGVQSPAPTHQFTVLLSATRRGARLARLLAREQLRSWGRPYETAEHVVAELANNAALHGHVPGRSFRLALMVTGTDTLRIEVTDARADRHPPSTVRPPLPEAEAGRGLLLVEALADRWGTVDGPVPCKTVWAELVSPPSSSHR
ncbi:MULTISPECIES: ATP-binding protein [Streptomyces]|uniref:ATP-binding protein n=1 Tax=Streptomyces TaxID=1883 RepID=UPI001E58AFAF|nr:MULTISPECIES: ATP-binding protein [Streptomyces]UFQ15922.1 ATP-binding protein [Streptomyces huasconensis]WCL85525.1 ATP-binding protein [Streptomyces sp. JCM 35825]